MNSRYTAKKGPVFHMAEPRWTEQLSQLLGAMEIDRRMGQVFVGAPLAWYKSADQRNPHPGIQMDQGPEKPRTRLTAFNDDEPATRRHHPENFRQVPVAARITVG